MTVPKKISNFQYSKAERSDIETFTELLCELYENHSYAELLVENKGLVESRRHVLLLAFDGKKPIGGCHSALRSEYVNGKENAGTAGYLEAIYVRPEYRLHGVAASLVSLCEKWALSNGCGMDNEPSFFKEYNWKLKNVYDKFYTIKAKTIDFNHGIKM